MYDIISIGSSIIDSFITSQAFMIRKSADGVFLCQTYGEKIDVDEYIVKTGGGGSNTAVGFARAGFRTALVSELGKDIWAKFIIEELHKEFVSTNLLISEKNEKTGGSIILLGEDGGRTVMVHRGAAAQLDPKDIPVEHISRAKWVHVSSIAGQEETLEFILKTVRESGAKLSWNPGNKELELLQSGVTPEMLDCVEILIVNKHEWESVQGLREELLRYIPHIVVTHGKEGGEVFIAGRSDTTFTSRGVPPVDETGAGDAFIVGYVCAQIKGKSIAESCEWGRKNAESVIAHVGAKPGLLTITQLESHNGTHD